jgi:hypothetical protein
MKSFSLSKILSVLANISLGIAILLAVVLFFIFLGFLKGRDYLLTLIVSVYPSVFLMNIFPFYEKINFSFENEVFFEKLIVFAVFFFITFFVFKKFINSGYEKDGIWRFVEIVVLSISFSGLLFAVLFNSFKVLSFYNFVFVPAFLFVSNVSFFIWFFLPIFIIFLFMKY